MSFGLVFVVLALPVPSSRRYELKTIKTISQYMRKSKYKKGNIPVEARAQTTPNASLGFVFLVPCALKS